MTWPQRLKEASYLPLPVGSEATPSAGDAAKKPKNLNPQPSRDLTALPPAGESLLDSIMPEPPAPVHAALPGLTPLQADGQQPRGGDDDTLLRLEQRVEAMEPLAGLPAESFGTQAQLLSRHEPSPSRSEASGSTAARKRGSARVRLVP